MKLYDQLDTQLEAVSELSQEAYHRLVKEAAASASRVEVLDVANRRIILGVKRGRKTVAAFEATDGDGEQADSADRLNLKIAWTEEMLEKTADLTNTTGLIGGAYWAYVKGLPGFAVYRQYLSEFRSALLEADPQADVRIHRTGELSDNPLEGA